MSKATGRARSRDRAALIREIGRLIEDLHAAAIPIPPEHPTARGDRPWLRERVVQLRAALDADAYNNDINIHLTDKPQPDAEVKS